MSIRLDWEIETERERLKPAGEDPESIRQRRRVVLRFFLFVFVVMLLIGALIGALALRLRQVEWEIEQLLRDTVAAEVTALRLGDRAAFLALQRSASDEWLQRQTAAFGRYQQAKQTQDVNLTGRILDLTIDGMRARVQIEEIIDGAPYARTWFYWRYEDGWRHVPPDFTFWGGVERLEAQRASVVYRAYDEPVARAVLSRIDDWMALGCAATGCQPLAALTIDIVPDEALPIGWSSTDPDVLQIPSPFARVARTDMLFDAAAQLEVANLLAERLVHDALADREPVYPADAYYLRQAVISWLVGRFVGLETNSFLIASLAGNYGEPAVRRLLSLMQPDSSMAVLAEVAGVSSLDQTGLDWRDLLTWRLALEQDALANRDQNAFFALYAIDDEAIARLAGVRYAAGVQGQAPVVVSVLLDHTGDAPVLRTLAQSGQDPAQPIDFRLSGGVWKRIT